MDTADNEDTDQHPDFRLLLSHSKSHTTQALPSREAKTTGTLTTTTTTETTGKNITSILDEQHQAYFQVLEEERRAAERTYSRVIYEPDLGLFRISVNRGNHFVSMGHTLNGQIYLYPEEALFLVDRGSLLAEHHGVVMTVQQMWSIYLQQAQAQVQDNHGPLLTRRVSEGGGRGGASKAMDIYIAYAYLKRLGFVVTRPGTYHNVEEESINSAEQNKTTALLRSNQSNPSTWMSVVWSTLCSFWRRRVVSVGQALGIWYSPWRLLWFSKDLNRPLVSNHDQLSHAQILEKIQIIPSTRLASHPIPQSNSKPRAVVDFEVYKPAGPFRKRQPGTPDYRVVVTEAGATLPTLNDFADYFQGQIDPATQVPQNDASSGSAITTPSTTASAASALAAAVGSQSTLPTTMQDSGKGKKRPKAPEWPKVLFAVVDGGQVTFLNIFNLKATP